MHTKDRVENRPGLCSCVLQGRVREDKSWANKSTKDYTPTIVIIQFLKGKRQYCENVHYDLLQGSQERSLWESGIEADT